MMMARKSIKNSSVTNDEDGEKLPLSKKAPLKKQDWLGLARKTIINSQSLASTSGTTFLN